jgi:hypothetical protein
MKKTPEPDPKPYPFVTLDTVLKFIQRTGDLPRAVCKLNKDFVFLHGWERDMKKGKLKLEFRIIEDFTFVKDSPKTKRKTKGQIWEEYRQHMSETDPNPPKRQSLTPRKRA